MRFPSWPGLAVPRTASLPLAYARPSTSFLRRYRQDVDARDKPGHDELLVLSGSPADFGNFIAAETKKWAKVIRATNIEPE